MSKKKHPEHVNHERWLVSYADFITLLFAFFVVLFASGQKDKRKQVQLAHSMQVAFDHNGIFDMHTRVPPISDDPNAIQNAVPSPLALPLPTLAQPDETGKGKSTEDRIRDVVREQIAHRQLDPDQIEVHSVPEGLVISLREAGFFASGSADLRSDSIEVLKALAPVLPQQPLRIEGHTDNVPIHTAQFATNWELSTARAATIARLLIDEHAVDPRFIAASGYAEFRPIADNATEQGRARNRRVDIVVLASQATVSRAVTPSHRAP